MKTGKYHLSAEEKKILAKFGENIKLARQRRCYTASMLAQYAGIARSTLQLIEKGSPGVAMGQYMRVLVVLQLEKDFLLIASVDPTGRRLHDAALLTGAPVRGVFARFRDI